MKSPNAQFRCGSTVVGVRRLGDRAHVVVIAGALVGDAVSGLSELIAAELEQRPKRLTLDLSDVGRIDAAGAHVLVFVAGKAQEQGLALCLVGVTGGPVDTALTTLEVTHRFHIVASSGEAANHAVPQRRGVIQDPRNTIACA